MSANNLICRLLRLGLPLLLLSFGQLANAADFNWMARGVAGIGMVVADAPKATRHYQQLLGITDWQLSDLEVQAGDQAAGVRVARGQFNGMTLELLQPLYGSSAISRYLASEGEGLFHLELAGLGSEALKDAEAKGYNSLLQLADNSGYRAQWLDSWTRLGVNIKLRTSERSSLASWGDIHLAATDLPLEASRITQLGVVVEDAMATAKAWRELLGIAPWAFVDFKAPAVSNGYYLGAKGKSDAYVHVAYGYWQASGQKFELELLEPVFGPTPHRDYLRKQGQGAHHLSLGRLANHDQLVAAYVSGGIDIQMQSDNGGEGRTATYLDTEAELGWVLELTRAFQGLGSLPLVKQLPR